MDKLILNFNFHGATEDQSDAFSSAWYAFDNNEDMPVASIQAAWRALHKKICTPAFLSKSAPGVNPVKQCLQTLTSMVENAGGVQKFQNEIFEFYVGCLVSGPSSGHVEIMKDLSCYGYILANVLENQANFQKLIATLKPLTFTPSKSDADDMEDYIDSLNSLARSFMQAAMSNEDVWPRALDQWLDTYVVANEIMSKSNKQAFVVWSEVASTIRERFRDLKGHSFYMLVTNEKVISDHMARAEKVVDSIKTPSEELVSHVTYWFRDICETLNENAALRKTMLKSIVEIMLRISKKVEPDWLTLCEVLCLCVCDSYKHVWKEIGDDLISLICNQLPETIKVLTARNSEVVINMAHDVIYAFLIDHTVSNVKQGGNIIDLLCSILVSGIGKLGDEVRRVMESCHKILNWKENGTGADKIIMALRTACDKYEKLFAETNNVYDEIYHYIDEVANYFIEIIEKLKLVKFVNKTIVGITCDAIMKTTNYALHQLAYKVVDSCVWTDEPEQYTRFLDLTYQALEADIILLKENITFRAVLLSAMPKGIEQYGDVKKGGSFSQRMMKILKCCISKPLETDEGEQTCYETFAMFCVTYFIKNAADVEVAKLFAPVLLSLREYKDENVNSYAISCLNFLGQHPQVLADITPQMIDLFLQSQEQQYISSITAGYPTNADSVHKRLGDFVQFVVSAEDDSIKSLLLFLVDKVADNDITVFTEEHAKVLGSLAEHPTCGGLACSILNKFVEKRPGMINCQIEVLQKALKGNFQSVYAPLLITCWSQASLATEKTAQQVLQILTDFIEKAQQTLQVTVFYGMRLICVKYPPLAIPYKDLIIKLKVNPQLQEGCVALLDVLEGRSLAGLSDDVETQKTELKTVEKKVIQTDVKVTKLDQTVKKQGGEIKTVKKDVKANAEKVSAVENKVKELDVKVEEVDNKTMSNAPAWSRDVSRLLNPESSADWRLLATRLGYDNKDIRGWATQHDPTMALLSEWYATHKTSEATHAVLKALEEMNRMDAAKIVREAKDTADHVVEDEVVETGPLPHVFLSYQWGTQNEVKLLKQHLEWAGYRCWMDLGQMGGGDKLFAKIDAGMRAAKVVICCVTNKYSQSDNCTREVNLATTLGKPIFPLLMSKDTKWPPEGAMGPIFSEYLFIRFFCRDSEKPKIPGVYWPESKFHELLMQLRFTVDPDVGIIKQEYKDWWKPKDDIIIVIPPTNSSNKQPASSIVQKTSAEVSRKDLEKDVFLSYQWGKQTEVQYLYKLLTSMGYTCWMDIYEMGGGDSLFDAIDKGIRNCKVVVSHVTSKYALSANCRREISLSDALKKPIIPLLLDNITWPPEGPMSLVFTQLLYIDFKDNNTAPQQLWSGSRFDQLIAKIDGYLGRFENNSVNRPISAKKSNATDPTQKVNNKSQQGKSNEAARPTDNKSQQNGAVLKASQPQANSTAPSQNDLNETSSRQASAKPANNADKTIARSCNII